MRLKKLKIANSEIEKEESLKSCNKRLLVPFIIFLGIVFRLTQYLFNRSLWLDEAMLSLGIIKRSFTRLVPPLDYDQVAPMGFLFIEKFFVELFGTSEYVLRLFPLVCGIISIYFFYKIAACCLNRVAMPAALLFFVLSDDLIFYSSEVKQYSSDVLVTLLIYYVTFNALLKKLEFRWVLAYALTGAVLMWFSFPSIFVLAGVGSAVALFFLAEGNWAGIRRLFVISATWLLSFTIHYMFLLGRIGSHGPYFKYWNNSFVPFPPAGLDDLTWIFHKFIEMFRHPAGFHLRDLAAFTFIVGCLVMVRSGNRMLYVVFSPLPFLVLASALKKYPIHGRLILFIVPLLIIFVAQGIEHIRKTSSRESLLPGITLLILLLLQPLASATYRLGQPRTVEEIRPVINHIQNSWKEGDVLYVYYASVPAFKYYSALLDFNEVSYREGVKARGHWPKYREDLNKLSFNNRVWILFSHVYNNEEIKFIEYLNKIGEELEVFRAPKASVYLFNIAKRNVLN